MPIPHCPLHTLLTLCPPIIPVHRTTPACSACSHPALTTVAAPHPPLAPPLALTPTTTPAAAPPRSYRNEMQKLLNMDPGMKRRFPTTFELGDYSVRAIRTPQLSRGPSLHTLRPTALTPHATPNCSGFALLAPPPRGQHVRTAPFVRHVAPSSPYCSLMALAQARTPPYFPWPRGRFPSSPRSFGGEHTRTLMGGC